LWGLPFQTHGILLPLLSQCLPVLDEICRRSHNFFGHVFDMNLLLSYLLLCTDCTLVVVHFLEGNMVYCAERFNCSINDLIYGRLSIIINSYVRNSVDETTLDRLRGFLEEA